MKKRGKAAIAAPVAPRFSWQQRVREGFLTLAVALSVFLALALFTYHPTDPAWSHDSTVALVKNMTGRLGAYVADLFLYFLGYMAYGIPLLAIYGAWVMYCYGRTEEGRTGLSPLLRTLRWLGFSIAAMAGAGLLALWIETPWTVLPNAAGGVIGHVVAIEMLRAFNISGAVLILAATLLAGI